jgi:ATP-dependent Clp protease ATP-binding subunit ClpA
LFALAEPGVGKTAVAEAIAQVLASALVQDEEKNIQIPN